MYSCVFGVNYPFSRFFLAVIVCSSHSLHKRVTGVKQQQPKKTTKSMISHQKTQEYIKGKSPLYIL